MSPRRRGDDPRAEEVRSRRGLPRPLFGPHAAQKCRVPEVVELGRHPEPERGLEVALGQGVSMGVDEPGKERAPRAVHDVDVCRYREVRSHRRDHAAANEDRDPLAHGLAVEQADIDDGHILGTGRSCGHDAGTEGQEPDDGGADAECAGLPGHDSAGREQVWSCVSLGGSRRGSARTVSSVSPVQ